MVDEAGPSLVRIDFFNYGEAFLHKRAVEMCEYIKAKFPHIYLYTSTNGLAFTEEQARRLAHSGIDEVTFSIDGATPDTYSEVPPAREISTRRSRICARSLPRSTRMGATCRSSTGATSCSRGTTATRRWTRARRLAADIGVDRLCWEITDHPEDMYSRRFAPGTADYDAIRHEIWDDNNLGNAIPGATPRARIDVETAWLARITRRPFIAAAGTPLTLRTRVSNLSTRPFPAQASYGRRLVRLGAQLCAPDGALINRDFARAWLPSHLAPGRSAAIPMTITAPATPGRYRLKFDLVSEGIDWFESCGSETTTVPLVVR